MNYKEIEKNIRNAYLQIQPDNQLKSILSDCDRKERRMILVEEPRRENKWLPRLAVLATAFVITFGALFGYSHIKGINEVVAATISLDVNPSLEIKINKNEKVLDVIALNSDAEKILGDMDFKGSDLKVTVNALIGSLVRNGYINELTNSILISVDDSNDAQAKSLEEKLMAEISSLLDKGSVLAQQVKTNEEIKALAQEYGITVGKAQLIKELADKSTMYNYEDLAKLTINELNLLSKNLEESSIQRNGQPSDKAYIGIDNAKKIALDDVGVSEADVFLEKAELDYENRTMVYEIEFVYQGTEYEYVIDASTGDVIYVDREGRHSYNNNSSSTYTPTQTNNTINNAGTDNLVGEAKAKQIALSNAGVSESQISGYRIEREFDDGVVKYEIDFHVGNVEYDYEINANTGTIIKAEHEVDDDYYESSSSYSAPSGNSYHDDDDDQYKVENGKVYEYDDGRWEAENDKKVENGKVYEYDDGRWELDNDNDHDDWDDDHDDWDDDDD